MLKTTIKTMFAFSLGFLVFMAVTTPVFDLHKYLKSSED